MTQIYLSDIFTSSFYKLKRSAKTKTWNVKKMKTYKLCDSNASNSNQHYLLARLNYVDKLNILNDKFLNLSFGKSSVSYPTH